ncbi:MAG TPA: hypothetical protein VM840_00365, partial [Actinomycetota bacterium]|nr:hypothetical protein [Actinomycetota bacterium]
METRTSERLSLIASTIILIIGMMYWSISAAEDSRQRAAAGRGEARVAATPIPQAETEEQLTDEQVLDILGGGAGTQGPSTGRDSGPRPTGPSGPPGPPGPG